MGGLEWLAVGLVMIAVGGGLGYCLATFKYISEIHSAERLRQDLQKQLLAANGRANVPAVSDRPGGNSLASEQLTTVHVSGAPASAPPSTARVPPEVTSGEQQPRGEVASEVPGSRTVPKTTPTTGNNESLAAPNNDSPAAPTLQRMIEETAARAETDVHCLIDIDFLRQFAEKYGQAFQDYVSQHVEQVLRGSLQSLDPMIYRYEGQEFVVAWNVPPGSTTERLDAVRQTAAQLRIAVEQAFLQIGSERLKLTISLGLALCESGITGDQSLARADEALAAAKKAGRNRGYYFHGGQCLPVEPLNEPTKRAASKAKSTAVSGERDGALKQTLASKRLGHRDRRRHERKACDNVNLIAPCHDDTLPSMDKFQRVKFTDISMSGFSMIVPTVPATDRLAVALINSQGMIFMAAEVANIRQAPRASGSKPLLIVGCKFRQRLEPPR